MDTNITLLPHDEVSLRLGRIRSLMVDAKLDAILLTDFADIYYATGRVFAGYVYIGRNDGDQIYFVKRPTDLTGSGMVRIRKPEDMPASLGISLPQSIGMNLDALSANSASRLARVFDGSEVRDCSQLLREARAVKTDYELARLRRSGVLHEGVYRRVPKLYREGMTDVEFEIEIERVLRLEGCLGQFRIAGETMETYMGSVVAGDNADVPSPYDFAMGGAGLDPSLPTGADGSLLRPGNTVMVDLCGNFTGYMTDMSRVFSLGEVSDLARSAHECSRDICHMIAKQGLPGARAADLYEAAVDMVRSRGLHDYFMGHRQKAGFIGHGVGIEINELPVIAPRSRAIIARHNVVALEPKFVIPGTGPVGVENTYIVTDTGWECITNAPEQIIPLDE